MPFGVHHPLIHIYTHTKFQWNPPKHFQDMAPDTKVPIVKKPFFKIQRAITPLLTDGVQFHLACIIVFSINILTVFILINAPGRDANHKGGAFISPPFRYNMSQHLKCVYRYLRKVPSSLSKRKHITISFTRILQYRHCVLKQKRLSAVFTFPDGWHFAGADTLLTAVFIEHPKSPRLHAFVNGNTRDHRDAARPL